VRVFSLTKTQRLSYFAPIMQNPALKIVHAILVAALCSLCHSVDAQSPVVPLYSGLGSLTRQITTQSPEAQTYFNQGLCFLYAFNHDEAIRSFEQAAKLDQSCAMAWWGISIANGPHINNPAVTPERAAAAWSALSKARDKAFDNGRASDNGRARLPPSHMSATAAEKALIAALTKRYADPQPEDRAPLDEAYAAAMRDVFRKYPADADIGALFAEALMDLRPWDLWTDDGKPQPGTDEVVNTLESVLAKSPNHPLALHLYIHAVEASPHPEKANSPADRLRNLQPGLGHLVHMPSHIDVRQGRWRESIAANQKAIEADRCYRRQSPEQGFYNVYMAHNHHMLAYSAMMCGQSKLSISAINEMASGIPENWLKENAAVADGFTAMPLEVLIRFGRWDDVLAAPEPPEYLPIARAYRHAARGIAHAAKDQLPDAKREQISFLAAAKKVPEDARVGNNSAENLLAIATHLLAGEILYREGRVELALTELRAAAKIEDTLRYSEPPDWIHPVRHALGATLLKEHRPAEAEKVYRDDLARQPNNGWSLYGLAQSLHQQNKHAAAASIDAQFATVWKDADIKITSSCYCQP
jgi:tetratricopeptide (TPR) repeat protein